jgi:D-alanyl-D-alanine carboxypeptidase (penicillin-binding protein 5/6)
MNQRARQLGLENTSYANPIGLDADGNYSSARDLVTLAKVLRTNSFFKKVVDSRAVTLKTGVHPRTFANRNRLVGKYPFVNGVKTGHTRQAGYVLVGSASRAGVQLISAVLDTPSEDARDGDTMALYRWAFPRFQRIRAVIRGNPLASVPIRFRQGARLKLVAARTVRRIVLRGHRAVVSTRVFAPNEVSGPIRSGQRLGRVEVRQGGTLVATVPLIAAAALPAAGITERTKSWAGRPWVLVGGLAAIVGTFLMARRRRLHSARRPSGEARAA